MAKKIYSVIAFALSSSCSVCVHGQSNINAYGILDMGYLGTLSTQRSTNGKITKTTTSSFAQGIEANNRLGLKGQEDLGGGVSTFFLMEMGLSPMNPNLSGQYASDYLQGTTNNGGSAIDNRSSYLGIRLAGVGRFAFGRQYTPIYDSAFATDAGQLNGIAGDVIQGSNLMGSQSGNNTGQAFTFRASNALSLQTDVIDGFTASGMYILNNSNSTQTSINNFSGGGGNVNWNGWGLNSAYSWERLYVNGAYQAFRTDYSNGIYASQGDVINLNGAGPTEGQITSTGTIFNASQLSDKQSYLAATYDLDDFKFFLQWTQRKIIQNYKRTYPGAPPAGEQLVRIAQQIGARGFWTPITESWASVGTGQYRNPLTSAGQSPTINFVGWQVGTNYYFSRTTNLYAIYGGETASSKTAQTYGSGNSGSSYGAGLRVIF
jgi:predicted porin